MKAPHQKGPFLREQQLHSLLPGRSPKLVHNPQESVFTAAIPTSALPPS